MFTNNKQTSPHKAVQGHPLDFPARESHTPSLQHIPLQGWTLFHLEESIKIRISTVNMVSYTHSTKSEIAVWIFLTFQSIIF